MSLDYELTLKIRRYDPDSERAWVQDYHLKAGRILRFVDLFRKINDEQDPTLAWSSSCEHGQCGTCGMKINGKPLLTCELLVEKAVEQFKTHIFTVEPLTIAPVIRDLVIDLERAYERVHRVKPYIIAPAPPHPDGDEYRIFPRVLEKYVEATRCINCFCCATACVTQKTTLGQMPCLPTLSVSWTLEKQRIRKGWIFFIVSRERPGAERHWLAALFVQRKSILPTSSPWPRKDIFQKTPLQREVVILTQMVSPNASKGVGS